MCFSANASFAVSGLLLVVGVASVSIARKPNQLMLASVPFLFSIQQFTEGVLWTSLTNFEYASYQQIATNIFIFFGAILWPIWVPTSLYLLEEDTKRKNIMRLLIVAGFLVSSFLGYNIFAYQVHAQNVEHHILYQFNLPIIHKYHLGFIYLIPAVLPHFFSSFKKIHGLGIIILFSFFLTQLFYKQFVFSVWCFFAAIISVYIFLIVAELNEMRAKKLVKRF